MNNETRQGTDMEQDKTMANRGCQGCPYVSIWESKRRSQTVGYVVTCDHPDYEKMLGRLLVRREVFESRDEAKKPAENGREMTYAKRQRGDWICIAVYDGMLASAIIMPYRGDIMATRLRQIADLPVVLNSKEEQNE